MILSSPPARHLGANSRWETVSDSTEGGSDTGLRGGGMAVAAGSKRYGNDWHNVDYLATLNGNSEIFESTQKNQNNRIKSEPSFGPQNV